MTEGGEDNRLRNQGPPHLCQRRRGGPPLPHGHAGPATAARPACRPFLIHGQPRRGRDERRLAPTNQALPDPELTKNQRPPRHLAAKRGDPPRSLAEVDAASTRRRIRLPNRRTARARPAVFTPADRVLIRGRRVQLQPTRRPCTRPVAYSGRGVSGTGAQIPRQEPSAHPATELTKNWWPPRADLHPSRGGRRTAPPATPRACQQRRARFPQARPPLFDSTEPPRRTAKRARRLLRGTTRLRQGSEGAVRTGAGRRAPISKSSSLSICRGRRASPHPPTAASRRHHSPPPGKRVCQPDGR